MMQRASFTAYLSAPMRWPLTSAAAALLAFAFVIAIGCAPYVFDPTAVGREVAKQIRTATGLRVTTKNAVRFNLLPRPNIVADGIQVIDPSGAVSIDALQLLGHARLLPLLVGRVELTDVTLIDPQLLIDLDSRSASPDNTIGAALNGSSEVAPLQSSSLGIVSLVNGSAILKSRKVSNLPKFEKLNLTIDWPDLLSPATMTGSAVIHGVPTDFTTWLAEPSSLMRGGRTDMTINAHSTVLDINATGEITRADPFGFRGRIVTSATSLSNVLGLAGLDVSLPAPFANFGLTGDATFAADRDGHMILDLPNVQLRADNNTYDGTLAIQGGTKPLIAGTLASDQVNLAPFLKWLPPLIDDRHRWSPDLISVPGSQPFAFDLRVSAASLRMASLTVNDAAISILTREGRTEIGLIEGKGYGGSIRARLSVGSSGTGLNIRGAASLSDIDASTLGWDLLGRQVASGALTASFDLETTGESPSAWISGLSGSGTLAIQNGELSSISLGGTLQDGTRASPGRGRTPFQSLSLSGRAGDGAVSLNQGLIHGSDSDWTLAGTVDLIDSKANLTASKAASGSLAPQTLTIGGPLSQLVVAPAPLEPR